MEGKRKKFDENEEEEGTEMEMERSNGEKVKRSRDDRIIAKLFSRGKGRRAYVLA